MSHQLVKQFIQALSKTFNTDGYNLSPENFNANVAHSTNKLPLLHALVITSYSNTSTVVAELLFLGADVNIRDDNGDTPLHVAYRNHCPEEMASLLLLKGADVNARNKKRQTPLHTWLRDRPDHPAIAILLKNGADVNAKANFKVTPLHIAVLWYKVQKETVRTLLDYGADVNAVDANGASVLQCASLTLVGPEVVHLLLDRGAWVSLDKRIGRFYGFSELKFDKAMALDKKLIKCALLENPVKARHETDYRIYLQKQHDLSKVKKLKAFKRSCTNEVTKMKHAFLSGGISLWNFVVRDALLTPSPYPRGIFRELYLVIRNRKYVIYNDVLRRTVKYSSSNMWVNVLVQQRFHAGCSSSKRVELNEHCIREISGYLSQLELFHLVVAFDWKHNHGKKNFISNKRTRSNGPPLKKRKS